jgi:AraC-like DNA-binding protein
MKKILTEFANSQIFKPSSNKGVELHSWNISNSKGYKKFRIKSPHFHDEFQVGYLKKGLIENNYRDQKIIVPPNQLYIIEPHEIHSEYIVKEEAVTFDFIFIPTGLMEQANIDLLDQEWNKRIFQDLLIENKVLNNQLIQKLQTISNACRNLSTPLEREQSLIDFVSQISSNQMDLKERRLKNENKKIIANIVDYMNENIFTPISLDGLSNEMGVSKFHLGRLFLASTNMTIHKYLMNLKICKAKELLNNDHSIGDVASKLLFTDKSHFIKCFKRATSQTPGEFRNL